MAYDNRPNLSCQRFDQKSCDTLYLQGTNCICGSGGTISSNSGYRISGATFLSAGLGLNTTLIGCNASGGTAVTAIGAGVKAMGIASTSIGCGSCTYGTGSISVGSESKTFCNYSTIVGCGNVTCSVGANIFGGYGNTICSGNTNVTLIGMNSCEIIANKYSGGSSIVVVPDLAILTTPAGTGNILCWNSTTKKIGLTTGTSGAITGATNGLSVNSANRVGLGGGLTADTYITTSNSAAFITCGVDGSFSSWMYANPQNISLITYNDNATQFVCLSSFSTASYIGVEHDSKYRGILCTSVDDKFLKIYTRLYTGDTGTMELAMCNGKCMYIYGNASGFPGIQYCSNYSSGYTSRSLVDKGWVLSQISGFTTGGTSGVITGGTNGLTTDGTIVCLGGAFIGTIDISSVISGNTTFSVNAKCACVSTWTDSGHYALIQTRCNSPYYGYYIDIEAYNADTNCYSTMCIMTNHPSGYNFMFQATDYNSVYSSTYIDSSGVKYDADYRSRWTDRNLVDRGYINSTVCYMVTGATNGVCKYDSRNVCLGGYLNNDTMINMGTNKLTIDLCEGNFNVSKDNFMIGSGFTIGSSSLGIVYRAEVLSDCKIIAAGQFTHFNGISRCGIVRLCSNGSLDTSYAVGVGFNNNVLNIARQSDDKIIAVGQFTSYSGVTRNRIIRLCTNGSIDNTYNVGVGFNSYIYKVAIQSDDKIIVGGDFTTYCGASRSRIVRLCTNGSIDNTFTIGTGFNCWVGLNALAIQTDGKVVAGGNFTTYSGVTRNKIIRLCSNGAIDNTFVIGSGLNLINGTVHSLAIQGDGKILVGGNFNTYSGVTRNNIMRLCTNGSIDYGFDIGTGLTSNNTIYDMIVQDDGKILVGGVFDSYCGVNNLRSIMRLCANGNFDNSFNMGSSLRAGNYDGSVRSFTIQSGDSKILVSGSYSSYNGFIKPGLIRLNSDGTFDESPLVTFTGNTVKYGSDEVVLRSDSWQYFGDPDTNGTWRYGVSGGSFIHQVRQTGVYVTKDTISP
jgi:uncharacterized delta-60 repeat protein